MGGNHMNRKLRGILLIILGIYICISLIVYQAETCYRIWSANDCGKADMYPIFSEYFWKKSQGAVIISVIFALPGVLLGTYFLCNQNKYKKAHLF
jgi:hypothetical protein